MPVKNSEQASDEDDSKRSNVSNGLPRSSSSMVSYAYILRLLNLIIFIMYVRAFHIVVCIFFLNWSMKIFTYSFPILFHEIVFSIWLNFRKCKLCLNVEIEAESWLIGLIGYKIEDLSFPQCFPLLKFYSNNYMIVTYKEIYLCWKAKLMSATLACKHCSLQNLHCFRLGVS